MKTGVAAIAATLLVSACSQSAVQQPAANSGNAAEPAPGPVLPVSESGTGPSARTPNAQPADTVDAKSAQASVDPKSTRAALDIAGKFADLLNARKFDEAYMLLGPGAPPRAEFEGEFAKDAKLHVTVGEPGAQEGAAGSSYLSVPLRVSGRAATLILRRVNDVPGSTEAQRRWHIERFEWGNAP
jgi:hypothetical protein